MKDREERDWVCGIHEARAPRLRLTRVRRSPGRCRKYRSWLALAFEGPQAIAAGMPPCPSCGGRNVRPAQAIRLEDKIRALLRYVPYRCRTCQYRFYKRPKLSTTAPTSNEAKAGS